MANQSGTARQAIKVWLAQHDLTQRGLAKKLRISDAHLSNILSGHTEPADELKQRITRVTGIDLAAFESVA